MSSMQEVAQSVENIFSDELARAAGHLATARALIESAQARFTDAVGTSSQESVGRLQGLFVGMLEGIEEVVGMAGTANDVKGELFDAWGVDASQIVSEPLTADTLVTAPAKLKPKPEPIGPTPIDKMPPERQKLTGGIQRIMEHPAAGFMQTDGKLRTFNALRRAGVGELGDILLLGKEGLDKVNGIGGQRRDWLIAVAEAELPGYTVPDRPDPAFAATICPSLRDVPAAFLELDAPYHAINKLGRDARISVHDIVTRPFKEVMNYLHDEVSGDRPYARAYNNLVAKAKIYARRFNEEKARQQGAQ